MIFENAAIAIAVGAAFGVFMVGLSCRCPTIKLYFDGATDGLLWGLAILWLLNKLGGWR